MCLCVSHISCILSIQVPDPACHLLPAPSAFRDICCRFVCYQERELEPYRQERKQRTGFTKNIKTLHADVQFRSEEELDDAIRSLDYRMTHESISKAEEATLFKQVEKMRVRSCALLPAHRASYGGW